MNSEKIKIMGLKNKIMGFFFLRCIELEAVVLHPHPHDSF